MPRFRSLALRQRLAAIEPGNIQTLRDLSLSYNRVGAVLAAQGKLDEEAYRDSLAAAERLVTLDRGNSQWQREVAVILAKLASVQVKLGAPAEALNALQKGRAIIAALLAIAPGNTQWKTDLVWFDDEIARIRITTHESGRN